MELLLTRFATFGKGSLLMDEMEGKGTVVDPAKSLATIKHVLSLLLSVCVFEVGESLSAAADWCSSHHESKSSADFESKESKGAAPVPRRSGALAILM